MFSFLQVCFLNMSINLIIFLVLKGVIGMFWGIGKNIWGL